MLDTCEIDMERCERCGGHSSELRLVEYQAAQAYRVCPSCASILLHENQEFYTARLTAWALWACALGIGIGITASMMLAR